MLGVLAGVLTLANGATQADVFHMPAGQTSQEFVAVGNAGNAADPSTGYGAVPTTYQMGKFDVTIGQYCQFLNAVAKTDPHGLYNPHMGPAYTSYYTQMITQSGSSGSYTYSVTGTNPQAANCPIYDVQWADAVRYCNWLQNNQPTGAEGPGTTETGAYTLNSDLSKVTRTAGATYFIPSENEWYKAAYYNASNASYWLYPTQSNTVPSNVLSATGTNNANFSTKPGLTDDTNALTPVGAFAGSPGPYGTYDMGGDLQQWTEAKVSGGTTTRILRGGDCFDNSSYLASNYRTSRSNVYIGDDQGFRVASAAVPEPGSIVLLLAGALAIGILRRRRNA
jgi:formylglycine-generating enzyme required for sulfatase activity